MKIIYNKADEKLFRDKEFDKVYYVGQVKNSKLEVSVNLPVLEDLWV